jgi:acyl-CoA thioesterase YciA
MAVAVQEQVSAQEPKGELASRVLAMPSNANPRGDIFGGWIMSLMDAAAAMTATKHANGRVVTVAVSDLTFVRPIQVGDAVCCYTDVTLVGRTSLTLDVEIWVLRQGQGDRVLAAEGEFTFVAIDENGRPRRIARRDASSEQASAEGRST